MTAKYHRPRYELVTEALLELGESFTADELVAWFDEHYSGFEPNSLKMLFREMSVNSNRKPSGTLPDNYRVLYGLGRGTYTRYRPDDHGILVGGRLAADADDGEDPTPDGDEAQGTRFPLEEHLEEFMEANWASIDFGVPLQIWTDGESMSGRQYETDVGRIDFLCTEKTSGDLVVVELKRGRTSDRVVGQVQRYMGWVQEHLADGRRVRGLIITHEYDDGMRYALKVAPNIDAWTYRVHFELVPAEQS